MSEAGRTPEWHRREAEYHEAEARLHRQLERQINDQLAEQAREGNAAIPVDRDAVQLVSGAPVPPDRSHIAAKPNGQQQDYVVLSDAERAKGFVRPFRDAYRHQACGKITTMARAIAETYARDPFFYSGTFCTTCSKHFPVGEEGEFTWYEMDGREGPRVGT